MRYVVRQVEEEGLVLVGAAEVKQSFRHNCVPKYRNELKDVTRERP